MPAGIRTALRLSLTALLFSLLAVTAEAAPVTLHFQSPADSVSGQSIRGQITYEGTTAASVVQHTATSSVAIYRPAGAVVTYEISNSDGAPIFGKTDVPPGFSIICQKLFGGTTQDVFAFNAQFNDGTMVFISISDLTGTLLPDTALPLSSPTGAESGSWLVNRGTLLYSGSPLTFSDSAAGGSDAALLAEIALLREQLAVAVERIADLEGELDVSQQLVAMLQESIASQQQSMDLLSALIGAVSGNPEYSVPGDSLAEQIEHLSAAIAHLNPGQKRALYTHLTGERSG